MSLLCSHQASRFSSSPVSPVLLIATRSQCAYAVALVDHQIPIFLFPFLKMTAELSHAIDLFLHKDRTSYFFDDTIAIGTIAPFEPQPALAEPSSFNWDLPATSAPMLPAFRYISNKLTQRELSVALIISDHEPYVIPVWPLPRKSQIILAQIVRKAVKKFSLQPSWLTALASASNKCLPKIFDTHRPDSYIVRRSIVQHELIFGEEGLTLLNIDHIYTFKQLLCTLSKRNWVPRARDVCLSSCVHLLHRINEVYTDPKMSGGYLKRVYLDVEFQKQAYEEVTSAYNVNYCTASIKDVTMLEPDFTALSDITLDFEREELPTPEAPSPVAELPDTSPESSTEDLISPIATVDLSTLDTWNIHPTDEENFDIISPITVKYPTVRQPSDIPESPLDPDAPWSPAIPPPLNTRRASISPYVSPPSSNEAETWLANIPTPREMIESWSSDIPTPLKSIESTSSGELKSPFEYVRTWVESWSTHAPEKLCENCHEIAVQPLMPRRFTMA